MSEREKFPPEVEALFEAAWNWTQVPSVFALTELREATQAAAPLFGMTPDDAPGA